MPTTKKKSVAALPVVDATCGCGTHDSSGEKRAIAVDPDVKDRNLKRLRRIEGQVRGLQRMVGEDAYCIDILTQVSAVQTALEQVSVRVLDGHVRHCVADAVSGDDPAEAEAKLDELMAAVQRYAKSR